MATKPKGKPKSKAEIERDKKFKAQQFKEGQSGNPDGRPAGAKESIRSRLRKVLEKQGPKAVIAQLKKDGVSLEDNTHAEIIAETVVKLASEGDLDAIKFIANHTESPMPKEMKLNGDFNITMPSKDASTL